MQRLREELTSSRAQLATWDERINQARAACAAWQLESEEAKRKASIAEQQRDEVNILLFRSFRSTYLQKLLTGLVASESIKGRK